VRGNEHFLSLMKSQSSLIKVDGSAIERLGYPTHLVQFTLLAIHVAKQVFDLTCGRKACDHPLSDLLSLLELFPEKRVDPDKMEPALVS
jgi:hypothetical protein